MFTRTSNISFISKSTMPPYLSTIELIDLIPIPSPCFLLDRNLPFITFIFLLKLIVDFEIWRLIMKNKILVISTFFLLIISIFSLTYAANVTNSIENGVMDIKAAAEDTGNTVKDMAEDAGEGMKNVTDSVMNTANRTMDGTENIVDDSKNTIDSGNNETTTENLTGSYNTTKTDADIGTATASNNATMWMWIMLAVVAVLIIGLVWYYAASSNNSNRR